MRWPTWIRVVLVLSFPAVPAGAVLEFTPWAVPVALPENLQSKTIWALQQLPDGRLAAGFEGGVAIGVPGAEWTTVATPDGSPVQSIVAAHGRLLAVGGGRTGFVETGAFLAIDDVGQQIHQALPVPEGWLLAGPNSVWFVPHSGAVRQVPIPVPIEGPPWLGDWQGDTVVILPSQRPYAWHRGALEPWSPPQALAGRPLRLIRDGLCFTDGPVYDVEANPVLTPAAATNLIEQAGLIGAATGRPWMLCATYWNGLLAFTRDADTPDWRWDGLGTTCSFARAGDSFLLGTTHGAFGLADPNRVQIARLENVEILHLEAADHGARVVTFHGVVAAGRLTDPPAGALWPDSGDASITDDVFRFRGSSVRIPTRFVNGLAVCGDTAATVFGNTVLFVRPQQEPTVVNLSGGSTSLGTDGRSFFVGTHTGGVRVFSPEGAPRETIGSGRAKVRTLAEGRTVLVYWDGDVRDAHGSPLGHVPAGNPRDAAMVTIAPGEGAPATRRMAVLVTRPEGAPTVGLLGTDGWLPLELPDLASIDAESIAADDTNLYVAGRRGILQIRMPLEIAGAPVPRWHWSDGTSTASFTLPRSENEQVAITAGRWQTPPHAATNFSIMLADGTRLPAPAGVARLVPVHWGRNELTLEARRHGAVARYPLVVVRPFPWLLQPWAILVDLALLGAVIWGVARWRTRQLTLRTRELESAVEQRTVELRKANQAKEEFLASISHEIRNPLNGVVGICGILQDAALGDRERSYVGVLSGCAQQLSAMLDDVLDFSRIGRGEIALHPTDFEIGSLVQEAVRVMDPPLDSCTLQLPEERRWLHGDAGKIRQIVCNLVSNALKYGDPRRAGITLHLHEAPAGGTHIRVAVTNTGPTIPADELPRLFDSFRRGGHTGDIPGFGLGLAVCRRLAERMGGRMTAASAERTTEFALELDLPAGSAPAVAQPVSQTTSHALAIEDEEYNRIALGHALRKLGYTVDWAVDGATALQMARRQTYDLILTDWRLPDIEGDELCRQLLEVLAPPFPPIIAVTAYSSQEKQATARTAGMAGFITKPVTPAKLEQFIRNLDTSPRPRQGSDIPPRPELPEALRLLGDLGPTIERLGTEIREGWSHTETLARMRDPRSGRAAHALRSLLLMAGAEDLAEQFGLLENACGSQDWATADRLLRFLADETEETLKRLAEAGPPRSGA